MFTELYNHTDHDFMRLDLAEKMAERRRQSLTTTRNPSRRARTARTLFAPAVATGSSQAEGRA